MQVAKCCSSYRQYNTNKPDYQNNVSFKSKESLKVSKCAVTISIFTGMVIAAIKATETGIAGGVAPHAFNNYVGSLSVIEDVLRTGIIPALEGFAAGGVTYAAGLLAQAVSLQKTAANALKRAVKK